MEAEAATSGHGLFQSEVLHAPIKGGNRPWGQVLEFRKAFPRDGLWWPYKGTAEFEQLLRRHLSSFLRSKFPIGAAQPASVRPSQHRPIGTRLTTIGPSVAKVKEVVSDESGSLCSASGPHGLDSVSAWEEAEKSLKPQADVRWWPYLSCYPVNQRIANRYLLIASLLTAFSGATMVLPTFLSQSSGLAITQYPTAKLALPMIVPSLFLACLRLALVVAIRATLLDRQIILSVARLCLLLSVVYICCAALVLLGAEMAVWARVLLLCLVLLGVLVHLTEDMLYALRRRSFGDLIVELVPLVLFLYLTAKPIRLIF